MKKQLLYCSLLGAGVFTACTSDELYLANEAGKDFTAVRPKVDVKLTVPETRLTGEGTAVGYDGTEEIGAVLVDFHEAAPTSYWSVTNDTHVGNNKFEWKSGESGFTTQSTMVKGSWIFYTPYQNEMTDTRDGIKFTPKVVQKWASDVSEIAGVDFRVSPIIELGVNETGTASFAKPIQMKSVYSYVNIELELPVTAKVQKLVIKPSPNTPFYTKYKVKNTNLVANNAFVKCYENKPYSYVPVTDDWNTRLTAAVRNLTRETSGWSALSSTVMDQMPLVAAEGGSQDIWALDCSARTEESNKFQGFMAIPSGAYDDFTVYAYTSKGVYKYVVDNVMEAAENTTPAPAGYTAQADGNLYLRPNQHVRLGRIMGKNDAAANKGDITELPQSLASKVANSQLKTPEETNGTVVISQQDLIDVIKGIDTNDEALIRVLANGDNTSVEINAEVMETLTKRQNGTDGKPAKPQARLRFKDSEIKIVGGATAYDLHDVYFEEGCKLVSGEINIANNVNVKAGKKFTIAAGKATVIGTGACANSGWNENNYQTIDNSGTLVIDNSNVTINLQNVVNKNTMLVKTVATVDGLTNNSGKTVTIDGTLTVEAASTNNGTITNNKELNLKSFATFTNARGATIANKGEVTVSATVVNNGTITNDAEKTIVVKTTVDANYNIYNGTLNNAVGATITNYGNMFCHEGSNEINNRGTINAKTNSTTYITTNSEKQEATVGTVTGTAFNESGQVMGVIMLDSRDEDVSVTTKTQKGFIKWESKGASLAKADGDKFNYVILPAGKTIATTVPNGSYAKYIECHGGTLTLQGSNYGMVWFRENSTTVKALVGTHVKIGKLMIGEEISTTNIVRPTIKVPTENAIGVYDVDQSNAYFTSSAKGEIVNYGTLLVGGNFYTNKYDSAPTANYNGTFASGDGGTTAFHWNDGTSW